MSNQPATNSPHPATPRRGWIKMFVQPGLLLGAGALVIFAFGAAQRLGWLPLEDKQTTASESESDQLYICPMMCTPPLQAPGKCPVCGMDLKPVVGGGERTRWIDIDPAARRIAGIKTAAVESAPMTRAIHAIGEIRFDEGSMAAISAYVDGRLERLYADYTGVVVHQNDDLALLYSPEIYAVQVELLQSKQAANENTSSSSRIVASQQRLYKSARRKLAELGMTDEQVRHVEQTNEANSRVRLSSPINGTVIEKLAVEGQYVKTGDVIYRVANLTSVWLMLELFPEDAAMIHYGQKVEAKARSLPGRTFAGRVAFVDPMVDPKTRTVGVRVVMPNPDGLLRIGDFARATVQVDLNPGGDSHAKVYDAELAGKWISPRHPQVVESSPGHCRLCGIDLVPAAEYGFADAPIEHSNVLTIPRTAVLKAGAYSVVYVEKKPGRFEIRTVIVGSTSGDRMVILDGLNAGERVAMSGNFLIDSQMQFVGNPSLIDPTVATTDPKDSASDDTPSHGGYKKAPLELDLNDMQRIAGDTGEKLEQLFVAYFAAQSALSGDQPVNESQALVLGELASELADAPELPDELKQLLVTIAEHSKPLYEQTIEKARYDDFRPISKAVLLLAARVRGGAADSTFIHFNCPMVKGGGGDWLQPSKPLMNPYWGSRMLHCGKLIHELPAERVAP